MKLWKRALAGLTAAAMAGVLAACSPAQAEPETTVIDRLTGMPEDTVLFTVDGSPVTAGDYCYWLAMSCDNVSYYLYAGGTPVWTDEISDGTNAADYVKSDAMQVAKLYRVLANKATELGCVLTEEDEAELDETWNAYITSAGETEWNTAVSQGTVDPDAMSDAEKTAWIQEQGAESFARQLQALAVTEAGVRENDGITLLYNTTLREALFGEGGPNAITDEDMAAWLAENGIYRVKHILISTVDDAGNQMDEAAREEARQRAQGLLDQLNASDDPAALFDQLMQENSEDVGGLLYYPDGYTFDSTSSLVDGFAEASLALAEGEISGLVETDYGYHIILRLPGDTEETRTSYENEIYNSLMTQWMDEAQVEETEEYAALDPAAFFDSLTALREELYPAEDTPAETQPAESAPAESVPAESPAA